MHAVPASFVKKNSINVLYFKFKILNMSIHEVTPYWYISAAEHEHNTQPDGSMDHRL